MATEDSELLAFDRNGFLSMIYKNPKIALNVIDKLCRRLQNANLQVQHLVRKNAKGLVALNLAYGLLAETRRGTPRKRTVEEIALGLQLPIEVIQAHCGSGRKRRRCGG